MGVKSLVSILILILLISGCSTKTKPVVTDLTEETLNEEAVEEEQEETTIEEEPAEPEINETQEELPPGTHIIVIKDLKLEPQELTIKQGETIIWKHEDSSEEDELTKHYIAAHSNEFRSEIFYFGQTFNHTFENTGEFTYIDVLYKDRKAMAGTIIVE